MTLILNKYIPTDSVPCHSSGPNTNNRNGNRKSSILTTKISSVSHCLHDYEESSLTAVLCAGKNLRLQVESLQRCQPVAPIPYRWKCGLLKRCLLGASILTGAGVLGNAVYRNYSARDERNTEQPESLFSPQALQDIRSVNKTHSHHHTPEYQPTPSNNSLLKQHSRNRRSHKENNTRISVATKKMNHAIIKMLRGKTLPKTGKISRAKLLYAVSVYLFHSKNGITDHTNEVILLAKNILSTDKLYPVENHKPLSFLQAKSVVRTWVFQNVLGKSPVEFIAEKMKQKINSPEYTVATVHHFLPVNKLPAGNHPHFDKLSEFEKKMLLTMWKSFLNDEMPFLLFNTESIKNLSLSDYVFANLYTGSLFLKTVSENEFSAEEAISAGEIMWDLAVQERDVENKQIYYRAPALFFKNILPPTEKEQNQVYDIDPVKIYIKYRIKINEIQNDIKFKYDRYITTTKEWHSKSQLNNNILSQCLSHYFFNPAYKKNKNNRKNPDKFTNKFYLNGMSIPCNNEQKDLNDKYKNLTTDVADSFFGIDEYIILAAIRKLPEDEQKIIYSPHAIIHRAEIRMQTNRILSSAYGMPYYKDTIVSLKKNTDLISVHLGQEKIIYAIKADMGNEYGYRIIRVDREIRKYIDNDILDYDFNHTYEVYTTAVKHDNDLYHYSIQPKTQKISDGNNNLHSLISFLSNRHRNYLYQYLYESGDDQYNIQKVWDIVKDMIPFYEYVEGIVNNDPVQSVPSCLMDAGIFIPTFASVVSLSEKFGTGITQGLRSGALSIGSEGIKAASKNLLLEMTLPATAELASLGKNVLRNMDPGFELITDISSAFNNRVVSLMSGNKKTAIIAQKITSAGLPVSLPKKISDIPVINIMPEAKLPVAVSPTGKKNDRENYQYSNKETDMLARKQYLCSDNGMPTPSLNKARKNDRLARKSRNKKDHDIFYISHREKRGSRGSKSCSNTSSYPSNKAAATLPEKSRIIGSGSVSTVYDLENGYVEKIYKGKVNENNKSRLTYAQNNRKGFNLFYGKGSASIKLNHDINNEVSASVILKKIDGDALSDIPSLANNKLNEEIVSAIESTHPDEYLSNKLQKKGIIHHDINKGNIIYNKGEFFLIDFDSANFMPEGKQVSDAHTESMRKKLKLVFNDVLREIKKLNRQ